MFAVRRGFVSRTLSNRSEMPMNRLRGAALQLQPASRSTLDAPPVRCVPPLHRFFIPSGSLDIPKIPRWEKSMNLRLTATIVAALLLAACGGYGGSKTYMPPSMGNPAPASSTPAVTETILGSPGFATPGGFTLYMFSADGMNVSNCNGTCANIWPPFMASSNAQSSGGFSVIMRSDGSHQWAFNGHPLYTFTGDTKPGQANGQNLTASGGTFTVARP
jgi:predicted lipoprotein with Yx(FWY)xxD motif